MESDIKNLEERIIQNKEQIGKLNQKLIPNQGKYEAEK